MDARACAPCPQGSFSAGTNAVACALCPLGYSAPAAGSTACTICAASTYAATEGAGLCTACPSGRITSLTGQTAATACVSPASNYAFGIIALVLALPIAYFYIYRGRFYEVANSRYYDDIAPITRALQVNFKSIKGALQLVERLRKLRIEAARAAEGRLSALWLYWKWIKFIFVVTLAVSQVAFVNFIMSLLRIGFNALLIYRGYRIYIKLPYLVILNLQLDKVFVFVRVILRPFVQLLSYLADINIDINLEVVNITCEGSKLPLYILYDFLVFGIVLVVIVSDFTLLPTKVYAACKQSYLRLYQLKISLHILNRHHRKILGWYKFRDLGYGYMTKDAARWLLVKVVSFVTDANPIPSVLSVALSLVQVSRLFAYSAAAYPSCNEVVGLYYFDAVLGYGSAIVVWMIMLPVIYTTADALVPFWGEFVVDLNDNEKQMAVAWLYSTDAAGALDIIPTLRREDSSITPSALNNLGLERLESVYRLAVTWLSPDAWVLETLRMWVSDWDALRPDPSLLPKSSYDCEPTLSMRDLMAGSVRESMVGSRAFKLPPFFSLSTDVYKRSTARGAIVRMLMLPGIASGFFHMADRHGRRSWRIVAQKYLLFLRVSLLGVWDERAYDGYGIGSKRYTEELSLEPPGQDEQQDLEGGAPDDSDDAALEVGFEDSLAAPSCVATKEEGEEEEGSLRLDALPLYAAEHAPCDEPLSTYFDMGGLEEEEEEWEEEEGSLRLDALPLYAAERAPCDELLSLYISTDSEADGSRASPPVPETSRLENWLDSESEGSEERRAAPPPSAPQPAAAPAAAPVQSYEDPSELMGSLLSIRAVVFVALPLCSVLTVFVTNTSRAPLFSRPSSKYPDIRFSPLLTLQPDMGAYDSFAEYPAPMRWCLLAHEVLEQSRALNWLIGVFSTAMSIGILYDTDTLFWVFSSAVVLVLAAVLRALDVIVFVAFYFDIVRHKDEGNDLAKSRHMAHRASIYSKI